jgi:hypothetical protein
VIDRFAQIVAKRNADTHRFARSESPRFRWWCFWESHPSCRPPSCPGSPQFRECHPGPPAPQTARPIHQRAAQPPGRDSGDGTRRCLPGGSGEFETRRCSFHLQKGIIPGSSRWNVQPMIVEIRRLGGNSIMFWSSPRMWWASHLSTEVNATRASTVTTPPYCPKTTIPWMQ